MPRFTGRKLFLSGELSHWAPTGFEADREHCGSSMGLPPRPSAAAGPEVCWANPHHKHYPWKLENPHRLTQIPKGVGLITETSLEKVVLDLSLKKQGEKRRRIL